MPAYPRLLSEYKWERGGQYREEGPISSLRSASTVCKFVSAENAKDLLRKEKKGWKYDHMECL